MDIVVCVKQIIDLKQVRIKPQTREPVLEGLPLVLSDLDKNALEAAIKLKEADSSIKITALSIGRLPKLKDTIKEALAMGADQAVLVIDPALELGDPAATAQVLAAAIRKIGRCDLLLLGEGSADNYSGQTGPRLAELLGLPQVTFASGLELADGKARITRSLEDEAQVVECPLPALVTVLSEINTPRIPALAQILKAGRKPTVEYKVADLGAPPGGALREVVSNLAPQQERKTQIFEGEVAQTVSQLFDALVREGAIARS